VNSVAPLGNGATGGSHAETNSAMPVTIEIHVELRRFTIIPT
jgi:hypothetical protein